VSTQGSESRRSPPRVWPALSALLLLFLSGGRGGDRYLVGAHYYVWYPANFAQGYLRAVLEPRQAPVLGEYDSRSPTIAERQIAIATAHGIYESSDLANRDDRKHILFDAETTDRFVSDMVTIARRYFAHPSYLRIDGRPVVILYITRMVYGRFPQAMREMRRALAAEGFDPFVIGDEIYWAVVESNENLDTAANATGQPQVSRIQLFDAITAYNLYAETLPRHRGYPGQSHFVKDSIKLYRRYRDASAIPIIPGVMPGFNDRAHRLERDHFAIPRRWTEDAPEGSFFTESIERIAKPFVDDRLRMIFITSWNEWNEDTAIEPVTIAPPTADDISGRRLFTQGYAYEGFGDTYVDIVSERLRH